MLTNDSQMLTLVCHCAGNRETFSSGEVAELFHNPTISQVLKCNTENEHTVIIEI